MNHPILRKPHIVFYFSDTGGGHRSAAEAIIEAIQLEFKDQVTTEMVDFFKSYAPRPFNRAADMYPYIAGGTGLASAFPNWAAADGKLIENLRDPEMNEKIRMEMLEPTGGWEPLATLSGPEGVLIAELQHPEHRKYIGKRLAAVSAGQPRSAAGDLANPANFLEGENVFGTLTPDWFAIAAATSSFNDVAGYR